MNTIQSGSEKHGLPPVFPKKFFAIFFVMVAVLFSQNTAQAAITYFASASNPTDGNNLAATPVAVVPPGSMVTGDLVILVANTLTTSVTPAISATGGQTWTSQPANTTNSSQRIFWARYNGTWSTNPSVSFSTSVNTTVVMHVFRPTSGINTWAIDVAQTNASFAAPGGLRDVTINGITTLTDGALVFATWISTDNNTWGLQTAGWSNAGTAQYRNGASSDSSQSSAYKIMPAAGPSGNVVNRQTGNAPDAGNTSILAFREVSPYPLVVSVNRASTNPTETGLSVSWTVVFTASVSGVDTADFALVQGGGVTGASITSVTGSGTTWTVTANTGSGTGTLGLNLVDNDSIYDSGSIPLGGAGAGNGNFTGQYYTVSPPFCTPPSNIPAGVSVSCVCDRFGRASLNPSTIFGSNWSVSNSDGLGNPGINATTGLLRLTESTANNAKAATVPGIFPAAGNYISVEFNHYAYDGTGADGIAVTLSDYSVPAVPGAFGGSLGYAQRTGVVGFAGGWVGVALDEYGNYQNPTEGRVGGPGFIVQSVGVRGPGSGANGYRWMGGTASNPGGLNIDNRASTTPSPGYMYQVIVDARNFGSGTVNVSVNRDATTNNGSNYTSLFGPFNAYTEANYALTQGWTTQIVPDYWKISFTGSTGGSDNIHEIGDLRVCAQTVLPPTGGTASGFSAIDEAYPGAPTVPAYPNFQTGDIYMKLTGVPFRLWVAALTGTGISTGYSATSAKYVSVKLVDNSDNACGTDAARTCNAACTNKTAVEAGATQTATFLSGGTTGVASPSPTFTLNSAWKNLIAVMRECTTSACAAFTATAPACSADSFSVRPTGVVSVTSSNATNTGTGGTPIFKAGSDTFNLTATIAGIAGNPSLYTGTLKINSAATPPLAPATVLGTLSSSVFPAAVSGTPTATATGNNFTYSEVGGFYFRGYNPASDTTTPRGIYDGVAVATECASPVTLAQCDILRAATWTGIDSISTEGNCVSSSYSNTRDASGKYGCLFGLTADSAGIGRFTPAFFNVTKINACLGATPFTYSGQSISQVKVSAMAAGSPATPTLNYNGTTGLAKNVTLSDGNGSTAGTFGNGTFTAAAFTNNGDQTKTNVNYTFTAKENPPVTLALRATDTDSVSSAGFTEETAEIRSGRARIVNAYGSELVSLQVPLRVEYYTSDGWVTNSVDTCTSLGLANLDLQNAIDNPAQGVATIIIKSGTPNKTSTVTVVAPAAGAGSLDFSAPLADGYADASMDLSAQPWLRYDWDGAGPEDDPTGRATFGLYRGSPRHIYQRERY